MWKRSPCAGLVDALEDNDLELAEAMVRSHVGALLRRMPKPQSAVLGCTHYPILEHVFQAALGAGVKVFSPGRPGCSLIGRLFETSSRYVGVSRAWAIADHG